MAFDPGKPYNVVDSTPTGLPKINAPVDQNQIRLGNMIDASRPAQAFAQAITTPQRGIRGLGVGAENLMEGASVGDALTRAAEAIRPGYEAPDGERLGAFAGEMVGSLPLAIATGGAAGGDAVLRLKMIHSAVSAATMSEIEQASKRGDVSLIETGIAGGLGSIVPVVGPSLKAIGRGLLGAGRIIASKVGVKPFALEEMASNPQLLQEFQGSAEAVGQKVVNIQNALKSVYKEASSALGKARSKFNLPVYFDEKGVTEQGLAAIEEGEFKVDPPEDLIKRFRFLSESNGMSAKARIRSLVELRNKIRANVAYSDNAVQSGVKQIDPAQMQILKTIADRDINNIIWNPSTGKGIPGGEDLRKSEGVFSEVKGMYDNLQRKLSSQSASEATLARIAYNDNVDEIIGRDSDTDAMIGWLEKKTGKQLMAPLRSELASRAVKNMVPPSNQGFFGSGVGDAAYMTGPTGLDNIIHFLKHAQTGLDMAGDFALRPVNRLMAIGGETGVISNNQGSKK